MCVCLLVCVDFPMFDRTFRDLGLDLGLWTMACQLKLIGLDKAYRNIGY